jgi:ATP-binding cassette subfamily F protein 3
MEKTIFDELYDEYPNMTVTQIRNALAVFLFKGEDVFKEIKKLSGGERARVELAKLMLKDVNFLIMDEPTNHLDIDSREALENALKDYDGTMLMVSHDRYFINKLADRILYMTPDGLTSYGGGYDYFMEHRKIEQTNEKEVEVKNLDYKEQKRLEAQKRKVVNRFKKVEELIGEAETEIEEKTKGFEDPEIAVDFVKAAELQKEIDAVNERLETLMNEWEELQEIIDENGYEV